ncbi:MAG TPA: PEP-CTERM sorting domain-containing protein [Thiobacillus sp.]|nr:MAG: hypothetical protein B7Y50_03980 [Hydrogenophilales bacterium 28-61-11]OYZ57997.1 MAG: hypothetical protein B7Y21_05225 [Hydrogenophilales bacterium 16-61-112]OZA44062.1 MAG: hypothetical protein B7X81_10460 [Hydrogenophilales bacterium 17-61-76]HQT30822.1 PEP-CTERM sorting domain-containing protein [Thiobacillus sp.]HQT69626.1 PEP-CTERM sorting domain-containing protein [Thiobacillus sp.]
MKSVMLLAALGGLALIHQTEPLAAEATKFVIDPAHSYVKAYVFKGWVNDGDTWDNSGVSWRVDWTLSTFQLTGSFTVETIPSGSSPEWNRLYLVQNEVVTDAPEYASFYLPDFFSVSGESVSYSSHPCFDTGFYAPPGEYWSCSGGQRGISRVDEGTLISGVMVLEGAISDDQNFWGPSSYGIVLPYGTEPDPELAIDYSYVNDLFQYHMVAVSSVPEPEPSLLMLAGVGLLGYVVRRRKFV